MALNFSAVDGTIVKMVIQKIRVRRSARFSACSLECEGDEVNDRKHLPAKDKEVPEDQQSPERGNGSKRGLTRRSFIGRLGVAGVAVSAGSLVRSAPAEVHQVAEPTGATSGQTVPVSLKINGQQHRLQIEPRVTLLDALRENLNLFGTKKGCDHGQCGACTVHVNGRRTLSCLTFAIMHQGDEITTIEGLAQNGQLHPVQAAFLEHDGFQCGYCTSGQIMSGAALLNEPCGPDDDSVRECMSGNICRCGAYPNIVAAVQAARKRA
jgi:xanthine dehydrogenase YagT iron-sulfur-binding subunit